MKIKNHFKTGILLLLAVFVLGVAVPAMAGANNPVGTAGKYGKATVSRGARTMVQSLAELTGKDVSVIQVQRREGKSIANIAEENGVDQDALINNITKKNQEKLQTRLDEGTITQEQYDSCLQNMQQNIKERIKERSERSTIGGPGPGQGTNQGQKHQRASGFKNGTPGQGQKGLNCGQGNCGNCPYAK
ncbi:MAG TPA: hypothetical protein DD791_08435 [Syntrophomonas sp.]|jgi:gas vesicle protein|nr:hypothetical protein [Syntrophomonas sp.]